MDAPNAATIHDDSEAFRRELETLLNRHSKENGSNTPDFILAEYLTGCLENFDRALTKRTQWYRRDVDPSGVQGPINGPTREFDG